MAELPLTRVIESLPSLVPFVGPEAIERSRGRQFAIRVGANESAFGISQRAREAMCRTVEEVSWYNDPDNYDLRTALARHHDVGLDEICISAGIDDLLGLVVRIAVEPGEPVVSCHGSYPTFAYHVQGFGGRQEQVPYRDDRSDLQALAAKVRETRAHLVYVANPDNPMGTWHSSGALREFMDGLPSDCIAIIDEAYIEFAPHEAVWDTDTANERLIRMRTFSKAHGMAGARVGYALAHRELVAVLEKVRNHFGVNRIAQAGALASLADTAFVKKVVQSVKEGRGAYESLACELGLGAVPSATNFVCIDLGSGERARAVQQALLERDVFVRMPSVSPQDRCVRVTVGTPEQRARFAQVFREAVAGVRPRAT